MRLRSLSVADRGRPLAQRIAVWRAHARGDLAEVGEPAIRTLLRAAVS
jgi:hypothetical protein